MRYAALFFMILTFVFGCLETQIKKTQDFNSELELEKMPLDFNGTMEEINDSAVDALFQGFNVEKEQISVVYFYTPNCSASQRVGMWVEQVKKKYNNSVVWYTYDISKSDGWKKYLLFTDAYKIPQKERYVPMVFVGSRYSWGIDGIKNNLTNWIDDCQSKGCYSPFEMLN